MNFFCKALGTDPKKNFSLSLKVTVPIFWHQSHVSYLEHQERNYSNTLDDDTPACKELLSELTKFKWEQMIQLCSRMKQVDHKLQRFPPTFDGLMEQEYSLIAWNWNNAHSSKWSLKPTLPKLKPTQNCKIAKIDIFWYFSHQWPPWSWSYCCAF